MNRLTIIPSDGAVYTDTYVVLGLDLSFIPSNVHALQWNNGAENWIEYTDSPNETITELPAWATQAQTLAANTYVPAAS